MLLWISSSFKRQIILILFSVMFIMGMLTMTKFYMDEKRQLKKILESQISQMSHRFSISVSKKVFFNNYFELSDDIFSLYEYNHKSSSEIGSLFKIENISVVNKDLNIVGHSNPIEYPLNTKFNNKMHIKEISSESIIKWNEDNSMLYLRTNIYYSNDIIGYLYMDINPILLKQSETLLLKNILIFIFIFVILLMLLSFFFAKWVDKPLLEIIKTLDLLGAGNMNFPVVLKRNDEFYILAKAIMEADARIYKQKNNLLNIQKDLENRVVVRTSELNEKANSLNDTLENLKKTQKQLVETEKMSALGSLVAGVAHEINTPIGVSLTGITHIESETRKIVKALSEESLGKAALDKYLDVVETMAKSMHISLRTAAQLVRSFKQVAIDQHTEDKRRFDLKEYVDEVLLSLHNKLKHTKIEVKNEIDKNIFIYSYAGIYSQMYTNFIMNSFLHAYDNDSVGSIILKATIKDDTLFLSYEDDGKGLEKTVLEKMFNPFFTTKMGSGGSGLGLSIIYNLVNHKLKGQIKCESIVGNGMKILITIPMIELKEIT